MSIGKKNIVLVSIVYMILGTIGFKAFAQKDTIWYNEKWQVTSKEGSAFYRPPVSKKGDLYLIKDYYKNGKLQMQGTSAEKDNDFWEGTVTWYNEDGKVLQSFTYKNNRLHGKFITFYKDEELVAEYKNGRFFSGKTNFVNASSKTYTEIKDSSIREVVYDTDLNGTRYEIFKKIVNNYPKESEIRYYGNQGEYLGTSLIDPETGRYKGVYVYYYKNPLRVKKIVDYKYKGRRTKIGYYPNGVVRERFLDKPEPKIEYYDLKGKLISTVGVGDPNKNWDFRDGKRVQFYSDSDPEKMHLISFIEEFDVNGNIVYAENFHENQQTSSKVFYENKSKKEIISFDEKGKEIAKITFKNYAPFQGILLEKSKSKVYEQGKLIKETSFYPDTTIPFSVFENKKAIFYKKNGDTLGEISSMLDSYLSEEEGTRFFIDSQGRVIRKSTFVGGMKTYEKELRYFDNNDNKTSIQERFYKGYDKTKEVFYYHDISNKRSVRFYKNGIKSREVFYDRKGKEISTYNYEEKHGSLFTYFYDTDMLDQYQEFNKGNLIKSKKYQKKYNSTTKESDTYVLIEDLDINTEAIFYNGEGKVIAKLSFKDQKPYEGVGYDYITRTYYTFKQGKKNGEYKKMRYSQKVLEEGFYINDLKEGAFVTYDYNGNKSLVKNYKNDKLEGETIYYDASGEVISNLIYKDDIPFQGKEIRRDEEIWYEQGKITKKIKTTDKKMVVTKYIDENTQEVIEYANDKKTKIYNYTISNYKLEGAVVRYDNKGNVLHKAIFDKGILKSGEVLIKENSYNLRDYAKMLVKLSDNTLVLKCYNKDDEIMLEIKEKSNTYGEYTNITKLGLNLNYIGPNILL
ncbi:hypothetical protein [uncultured Aquimarina sp.]|uniref:toxin-antitoxin system YwqK family antitoxin n=1 Tax=uncultured Aquimarina sp. TaxID=575652 RepID=UPI002607DD77|nr:hypothetical protein [uncultured Aquimarina sp.]